MSSGVDSGRRIGRKAFLALSGVTAGYVAFGRTGLPRLDLVPSIQSASGFTIYTVIDGYPSFSPHKYRLKVDGLVKRPLSLSLGDILGDHAVTEVRNYQCVTGWSVPDCKWRGLRLADLLDRASPHADAHALTFYSFDGVYTESLSMKQAQQRDVLVAYALNEKPLSRAQGAPLRLVVPGMYGYKYIKWVNRIEVVRKPVDGFWEVRGYDRDAYIGRSNGLI